MLIRLAVICALIASLFTATAASAGPTCVWAAHRGWQGDGATEDGMLAYREARAMGAPWLETDLYNTRDDDIVLMHDPTIDRTTDGHGTIQQMTLAQLRQYRLRDGTPIPSLSMLLNYVQSSGASVLLEIKGFAHAKDFRKLAAQINSRGLQSRVVVMSFDADYVKQFHAIDPRVPTSLLVVTRPSVAQAKPYGRVGIATTEFTTAWADRMHNHGIKVDVWVADVVADWSKYLRHNVELPITNDDKDYAAFQANGCQAPPTTTP